MVITDEEIEREFKGKNFGSIDTVAKRRKYLAQAVLQTQAGFEKGSTLTMIMFRLNLIGVQKGSLTKTGQMFLYDEFKEKIS